MIKPADSPVEFEVSIGNEKIEASINYCMYNFKVHVQLYTYMQVNDTNLPSSIFAKKKLLSF